MSEQQFTYRCDVCDEDHAITPKPMACWFKDQKRRADLESAVRRIEARVTGVRPTPPGVFPPMPSFGEMVCAGCRRPNLPLSLSGSGWMTCADCAGSNAYATTPAEAVIFKRGGYVPRDDAEKAAFRKATQERVADMTRRIFEADHRQTCEPRPTGGIVGLDAMLPPVPEPGTLDAVAAFNSKRGGVVASGTQKAVTSTNKALAEKDMGDSIMAKALEKHGAALKEACKAPTPAAMLGEAVALLECVGDMVRNAGDLDRHIIATIDELRTYIEEAKGKRDAEARESER